MDILRNLRLLVVALAKDFVGVDSAGISLCCESVLFSGHYGDAPGAVPWRLRGRTGHGYLYATLLGALPPSASPPSLQQLLLSGLN